jgi:hypothetical protein
MIRSSTIVYVVVLLALLGAYYFITNRAKPVEIDLTAQPTTQVSYLFTAEQGTPSSIQIKSKSGATFEVERGADNAWVVNQPFEAKADQGAAEAAASQITTLRVLDQVPGVDPQIMGLSIPEYVLTTTFTGGGQQAIDIGSLTPSQSGYYVRDAAGKNLIVSRDGIDALLGLLANPPYLETPTPSLTATETSTALPPSATPEAAMTASAVPTP